MIRKVLAVAAAMSALAGGAVAQVQQTGSVYADGGYRAPTPTTIYSQACNGGAGGIVGQGTCSLTGGSSQSYATLISNANAATTGTPYQIVNQGSYLFSCEATAWNGASAALQYLGPGGTNWYQFYTGTSASPTAVAVTANPSSATIGSNPVGIGVGAYTTIRVVVTGTPTGLTCRVN